MHIRITTEQQLVPHILSVCVCSLSYTACKLHVPYYIVISGLSGCTIIFQIFISQTAWFLGKKLLNARFVFWFPLHILSRMFLILRIILPDTIIHYTYLHVKYPLFSSDFNETWIFRHVCKIAKTDY